MSTPGGQAMTPARSRLFLVLIAEFVLFLLGEIVVLRWAFAPTTYGAYILLSIIFQILLAGVAFFSAKKLNEKAARLRRMK
jgi:hypothetical protein